MKHIYIIKDAVSNEDCQIEFNSQEEFERYLKGGKPLLEPIQGTGKRYKAIFTLK